MMGTLFLTVTTVTVTSCYLLTLHCQLLIVNYSLLIDFPYEAFESFVQFEVHAEGVSLDIEIHSYVQRFEVRMIRAVTPTGDSYKLAIKDLRITLARSWRDCLYKGIVIIVVACQQTSIRLVRLCEDVVAKNGFHIHADFCVTMPTLNVGV